MDTKENSLNTKRTNSKKSLSGSFFKNKTLESIIKKALFSLVFLLPLIWSPWTSFYDFGKYQLLFLLMSISFLVWGIKVVLRDKEISFSLNLLDISVLAFLSAGVLSTIFSINKYISLFGSYGVFIDGMIGLLSFGTIYFLVRGSKNKTKDKSEFSTDNLLNVFFNSFAFVLTVAYFFVSGLGAKIFKGYQPIQQRLFNTISFSLEGLAIFVAIVMVLLTGIVISSALKERRGFLKVLLFSSLLLLIVIDIVSAWIVLAVGLSFLAIVALFTDSFKKDIHQLLLPIFFVIIAVLFSFIGFSGQNNSFFNFPQERYLEQSYSYGIALDTLKESPKNAVIGSGLGTWVNDFLKNKSVSFNENSLLWSSRLNYSGSYVSGLIATTGVLGLLSYSSLIIFSLVGFYLSNNKKETLPYISALMAVLTSQLIYYGNTTLMFLSWFILGLGAVFWKESLSKMFVIKEDLSSDKKPKLNLGFSVFLILLSISTIAGLYFTTKEALADSNFVKAQKSNSLNEGLSYLKSAISENPYRINYRVSLSQAYMSQIYAENSKSKEEQDITVLQNATFNLRQQIDILQKDFPNYITSWELAGVFKRDFQNSGELGIKSFEKALDIDGNNPVLYIEIGKLYSSLGKLDKARESFIKSQELKSNYPIPFLLEALTYEKDDVKTAITKLKEADAKFSLSENIKYEIGRIYFDQEKYDLASSYFVETIQINPKNSNAYYSLGLIEEKKGNNKAAIAIFKEVLKQNPGNEIVSKKIKDIETKIAE